VGTDDHHEIIATAHLIELCEDAPLGLLDELRALMIIRLHEQQTARACRMPEEVHRFTLCNVQVIRAATAKRSFSSGLSACRLSAEGIDFPATEGGGGLDRTADLGIMSGIRREDEEPD
jgi:hypothetical protein